MNFYKDQHGHFLVQLDQESCQHEGFHPISVDEHEGDEHKHQPIVSYEDGYVKVKIGDIMHPMTEEHHISLIFLKTKHGGQYRLLDHTSTPIVTFPIEEDDKPIEVYGYCNLHGLWKEVV